MSPQLWWWYNVCATTYGTPPLYVSTYENINQSISRIILSLVISTLGAEFIVFGLAHCSSLHFDSSVLSTSFRCVCMYNTVERGCYDTRRARTLTRNITAKNSMVLFTIPPPTHRNNTYIGRHASALLLDLFKTTPARSDRPVQRATPFTRARRTSNSSLVRLRNEAEK